MAHSIALPIRRTLPLSIVLLLAAAGTIAFWPDFAPPAAAQQAPPVRAPGPGIGTPAASMGEPVSEFFFSVEGVKQGKLRGESRREGARDKLIGLGWSYKVEIPRDQKTGAASGRRTHGPLTITRPWGVASPQLFQALSTGESLKEVIFEFSTLESGGKAAVYQTVKLTGATVIAIEQSIDPDAGKHLEDVSFSFQKIEIENKIGKTTAIDEPGK